MKMKGLHASFAGIAVVLSSSNVFSFSTLKQYVANPCKSMKSQQGTKYLMVNNEDSQGKVENSSMALKNKANKMKMEVEKLELELNLEKIEKLEKVLKASSKLDSEAKRRKQKEVKNELNLLASRIDPSLLPNLSFDEQGIDTEPVEDDDNVEPHQDPVKQKSIPIETNLYKNRVFKDTISEKDLLAAIDFYSSLSKPLRRALAKAIDLDESRASPAVIVLGLYELAETISLERLQQIYEKELDTKDEKPSDISTFQAAGIRAKTQQQDDMNDLFKNWNSGEMSEGLDVANMVESFLPRVTRKDNGAPTKDDVELLVNQVLGKDTFQLSGKPESIPGGFILRGVMASNLKNNGDLLIECLDEKIAEISEEWNKKFQVCYVTDPTPQMLESDELNGSAVLVVHSRDMSPEPRTLLKTGVTSVSLFLTFVFGVSIFGMNDAVMERLQTANNNADFDLTWFNQLIMPFLISVGVTQACHEAAHLFVSKKDGFKVSAPFILPALSLPYLSFQNNIKTSPKNLSSLFAFAAAGPGVGMIVSLAFFLTGLQLTLGMDADALKYAPAVPVGFLQLSSLGANIVDYVLGGGDGIILQQDPSTPVILHPFAIGGLSSLMINALDTIPIAGTDGGRMSQALLGRSGHSAFSGVMYVAIIFYTLFSGHQDIFLTYLFMMGFAQKDLEIPSRNEVDYGNLGQAVIALTMWCVAILTLAPVN
jgi:hypothetical protein